MLTLVVDDNGSTNDIICAMASAVTAADTVGCTDPEKALALAKQKDFDIVITDYAMPGMTGVNLARNLRSLPNYQAVPIVMLTAITDPHHRRTAIEAGVTEFIEKPVDPREFKARIKNFCAIRGSYIEKSSLARTALAEVKEVSQQAHLLELEIINRLCLAIDSRDYGTGLHVLRVAKFASLIAEEMGMDSKFCGLIFQAAPLHDIGKIALPDNILLKDGKLTPDERLIIEQHTITGGRILSDSESPVIRMAERIAMTHHEHWDGKGYPKGLSGNDIPIEGRIVAVADVLDALTSDRSYRQAWSLTDSIAHIEKHAGTQFDPQCVAALLRCLPQMKLTRQNQAARLH